jgi:hypothetical protein
MKHLIGYWATATVWRRIGRWKVLQPDERGVWIKASGGLFGVDIDTTAAETYET